MLNRPLFLAIAMSVCSNLCHSSSGEVHVHGVSDLTIVVDKNLVEINFVSPTLNLMGFEGRAQNKEQLKAVELTRQKLMQYDKLFSFSNSRCVMAKSSLNMPDLSPEKTDEHHHHGDHSHDHGHSHEELIGRQHTDITAMYLYRCDNIAQLSSISVELFDMFPDTEKINAQWIIKSKQGAATLTKKNKMVKF